MKKNLLIIGAGGVAAVVLFKCLEYIDNFGTIDIASRNEDKCKKLIERFKSKLNLSDKQVNSHKVDARNSEELIALINTLNSEIVINIGPSFINQSVLKACLATHAAYIDTAIHEDPLKICEPPPWYANYEWKLKKECEQHKVTAILGAGFDPGVVNAYVAYLSQNEFDEIEHIDILDVNVGHHGKYFATNFDPEINFREFTGQVYTWQNSQWTSNAMFEVSKEYNFPEVGSQKVYLCGHDEIHSLAHHFPIPNIRFWMGFSDHYIQVFNTLKYLGLLSEQEIHTAEGIKVVPLKVVKAVLPDPASLAPDYTGKTCIGVLALGIKNKRPHECFIYNIADHQDCYQEVGSQAISYTAGVPAAAAAILVAQGAWDVQKMQNIEELPPDVFLKQIAQMGLTTFIRKGEQIKQLF